MISNRIENGLASAFITDDISDKLNFDVYENSSHMFLSLNYYILSYFYAHNGFIQAAVNCQVDDAFKNDGLIIECPSLSVEENKKLQQELIDNGDINAIKDCLRWTALYGGGAIFADTVQEPKNTLYEKTLHKKPLKFIALNRWQITPTDNEMPEVAKAFILSASPEVKSIIATIDKSRIIVNTGVSAPYLVKAQLGGWGLSALEPIIPPLMRYIEALNVSLELISEAKIDIIKMNDLLATLGMPNGERRVRERLTLIAQGKNAKDLIPLDINDDYVQKQLNFGSIPQMIEQTQYLICSALKRPYSKIFGKGSSGLSEQTIDLENYYTIVDAETRVQANRLVKWVINLRGNQLFGRNLDDFQPQWKPLKTISEKEETEINNKKIADLIALQNNGILTKRKVAEILSSEKIITLSEEEINKLDDDFEINADSVEDLI